MMKRIGLLLLLLALTLPALAEEAEPLFPARGENGLWGYINARAEWVIAPQFFGADDFRGDYAVARTEEDDHDGIIDREGNWVVPPEYTITASRGHPYILGDDPGVYILSHAGGSGVFDIPSGHFSGLHWDKVVDWLSDSRLIPVVTDGLLGYADRRTGETVIPCQYDSANSEVFYDGVALVWEATADGSRPVVSHLINEQGERLIFPDGIAPRPYTSASEGLIIIVDERGLYGYADTSGQVVIPPQYVLCNDFQEGLASVSSADGEAHYIDKTGATVLSGYQSAGNFFCGSAGVKANDQYFIIDRSGQVVPGSFMENGLAWDMTGYAPDIDWRLCYAHLVDRNGVQVSDTWLIPLESTVFFPDGRELVRDESGNYCYLDDTGAVAIPGPFVSAAPFCNGLARVCTATREGYIDVDGNEVCFWERE